MAATKKAPTGKSSRATKTKKAPAKKRVSSVAKKAVKKSKAMPKKKSPAPKKTKTSTKKKVAPNPKKIKPVKKETLIKGGGPLSFPRSVSLSLFVPALVPAHPDQLAVGLARFSGVFFVMIGAFFAGYHSLAQFYPATFSTLTGLEHSASLIETCDPKSSLYNPDDPLCLDDGSGAESVSVDETPDVTFRLNKVAPLEGKVSVSAIVESAKSVKIKAYGKNADEYYEIGEALQKDSATWQALWDTTTVPDDEYIIYAIVVNEFGSYDHKSSEIFEVENNVHVVSEDDSISVAVEAATSTDGEATSSVAIVIEEEDKIVPYISTIRFSKSSPVTGSLRISMAINDAEEVKVKAKHIKQDKEFFLGTATEKSIDQWILEFDTAKFPDGDYMVMVTAKSSDNLTDHADKKVIFQNATLSAQDGATTTDPVTSPELSDALATPADLTPAVDIDLSSAEGTELSGYAKFTIEVKAAEFVEVYMVPKYTNSKQFVGLAKRVAVGLWSHSFNTADLPNGDYRLFVRIKNQYGLFDSGSVGVVVKNESSVTYTESQKEYIDDLDKINSDPVTVEEDEVSQDTVTSSAGSSSGSDDVLDQLEDSLLEELQYLLNKLGAAIRANNTEAIESTKNEIFKLRNKIENSDLNDAERDDLIERLDVRLRELISRVEEDVEKTEKIVRERTGESASKDSDGDGITDYDEINIYKTDPFAADSDNDGFVDGAEVLSGYDPTDPTPETLVAYESPKTAGVVRSDLLKVETVTTITETENDTDGVPGRALISGKALPNSFVTIYIFSTPVVVTVKTGEDGAWEYHFDKELEDGSHEIYVGVTDNAGKIVAKSEPLLFVKEAQAFTPVDAEEAAVSSVSQVREDDSLASNHMIMIIGSISVVTIGLVLILIGAFLAKREDEIVAVPQTNAVTV